MGTLNTYIERGREREGDGGIRGLWVVDELTHRVVSGCCDVVQSLLP